MASLAELGATETAPDLAGSVVTGAGAARPYARSWVNVLIDAIERLPGPSWAAYLALAVAWVLFSLWYATSEPVAGIEPVAAIYYGALPFAVLFLIGHLDATARRAFSGLRPLLAIDDEEVREVEYRLSTVPATQAAIILVAMAVLTPMSYLADPVGSGVAAVTGFVSAVLLPIGLWIVTRVLERLV